VRSLGQEAELLPYELSSIGLAHVGNSVAGDALLPYALGAIYCCSS
jgi:hypothetical protein